MFSVFLELVKRVGIFIIIGQTIQHFGISKKYEKYMKLVISFMVVAQIIFAFSTYTKQIQRYGLTVSGKEYMKEWENNMQKVEKMTEEYNLKVADNLKEQLQKAEIQNNKTGSENGNLNSQVFIDKIMIP